MPSALAYLNILTDDYRRVKRPLSGPRAVGSKRLWGGIEEAPMHEWTSIDMLRGYGAAVAIGLGSDSPWTAWR